MPQTNNTRPIVEDRFIEDALSNLRSELARRLSQKGQGTFTSPHEILGIVTEEYLELVEAVKFKAPRNMSYEVQFGMAAANESYRQQQGMEVKKELLDIAVGCIFGVACIENGKMDSL